MKENDFEIKISVHRVWDPRRDNLDVEVRLVDGRRFGATYFTLQNVRLLFEKNRTTGECAGGLYLWAANMILVEVLTEDAIRRSVKDMLEIGEFFTACRANAAWSTDVRASFTHSPRRGLNVHLSRTPARSGLRRHEP